MVTSEITFHEDISQGCPFIQGPAVVRIRVFSRGVVSADAQMFTHQSVEWDVFQSPEAVWPQAGH